MNEWQQGHAPVPIDSRKSAILHRKAAETRRSKRDVAAEWARCSADARFESVVDSADTASGWAASVPFPGRIPTIWLSHNDLF
jgi:hypothetical protein